MYRSFQLMCMVFMAGTVMGQEKIDLYSTGLVNARENVDLGANVPVFNFFKPEQEGASIAFLILPGGGYSRVAIEHEGNDVAKRLNGLGYPAFVLRYRLPKVEEQVDKRIAPIQDAQTAFAYIREHTEKLGLSTVKYIGVIGFSAGGHLASTLSTHFDFDYVNGVENDVVARLRPDFSVLCYPVISMDDTITHQGSKKNLLGPTYQEGDISRFSNEWRVTKDTPPTFLMHAADDKGVPIANSERYSKSLQQNNVPYTFFRYETGGHGFGLNNKTDQRDWFTAMLDWVETLPLSGSSL